MRQSRGRILLRDNGLLLACLGLFVVFFFGMMVSGAAVYNQEQQEHGSQEQVSVLKYLTTGEFVEATFENWESEFLQMDTAIARSRCGATSRHRNSGSSRCRTGRASSSP
ncbi:MAG: DUF6766 family protein [Mycobacterium sp.]